MRKGKRRKMKDEEGRKEMKWEERRSRYKKIKKGEV